MSVVPRNIALLVLLVLCSLPIFCNFRIYAAGSTTLRVTNPLTGNQYFNFTNLNKNINDTFTVNVTIENVANLHTYVTAVTWNTSVLEYAGGTIWLFNEGIRPPEDFAYPYYDQSTATLYLHNGRPDSNFTGSTVLAQFTLRILAVGESNITFKNPLVDTILLDTNSSDIPFSAFNGFFGYKINLSADVNHDGIVDMKDIMILVQAFNSHSGSPNWNTTYDLNQDGRINMRDIMIAILALEKALDNRLIENSDFTSLNQSEYIADLDHHHAIS
jgi:hypothetical protein